MAKSSQPMAISPRRGVEDLEKPDDLRFQETSARIERAAWRVMVVIVLAALLGLFGGRGPLSSASAASLDSRLQVDYQRFTHVLEPTTLAVTVRPDAGADRLRLSFSAAFLDRADVQRIAPEPESSSIDGERVVYIFPLTNPGDSLSIQFEIQPESFGLLDGDIGLDNGAPVAFTQIVYP